MPTPAAAHRSKVRKSTSAASRRLLGLLPHDLRRWGSGGAGRGRAGFTEVRFGDRGDFGGDWGGVVTDRGGDVEAGIELTLEEAFNGIRKTISLELDEPCATCGGSGHVNRKPCATCRGTGWAKGRRHLEVKIPAGVDTGSRVRVAAEGPGGAGGGARGDLYLHVTVKPDPRFERKGDDLHMDLPVSAVDAALGTRGGGPDAQGPGHDEDPAGDVERPHVPAPGVRHAASQGRGRRRSVREGANHDSKPGSAREKRSSSRSSEKLGAEKEKSR